jgi:hypothetical protein
VPGWIVAVLVPGHPPLMMTGRLVGEADEIRNSDLWAGENKSL